MTALSIVKKFYPKVEHVVDSRASLKIEVTEKDDKNSKLKNHGECALATACKRKLHADGVVVSVSTAYVVKGNKAYRFTLPPSASREVVSFDRNGGFAPGLYQLNKPTGHETLVHKRKSGGGHSPKTGKQRVFRHVTQGIRTSLQSVS